MSKQNIPDFMQGYEYARGFYDRLMDGHNVQEILELAKILSQMSGEYAETARGMAAYCEELARRRVK